jgi:hypothetical protein
MPKVTPEPKIVLLTELAAEITALTGRPCALWNLDHGR